jgi:rod shape-determining protein MreD
VRRSITVRVVGPMQWIGYPALVAIAITILLAVPLRIMGLSLPEPVLPLVLAFAWPLIRPSILGPVVLFGLGLFLDLFWGGAAGLWPLALLVTYGFVLVASRFMAGQGTFVLFVLYVSSIFLAFVLAHMVLTLKTGNAASLVAVAGQMIPTLLLFPVADWLIQTFDDADVRFR